jgi:hypothetical protein
MANRYYGINQGERQPNVTEDSSTTSKAVELTVDLTKMGNGLGKMGKAELKDLVQEILNHILTKQNWPPA